jgi:glycosyltransferase involved in cell wall biosynthesis
MSLARHKVMLTIVDGGAPNRSSVPLLIDKLGLNGRVTFTGKIPISRLIQLYSQTEIAVLPSLYEGFGFPAAEAMACELPVITTTAGALPEVVGAHMKTGYLVPPRDAAAIAEGIDFLLDHPEVRQTMGKAARQRVLEIFTWENAVRELVTMYEEAINAHGRF